MLQDYQQMVSRINGIMLQQVQMMANWTAMNKPNVAKVVNAKY